jgi:hypothetical protein
MPKGYLAASGKFLKGMPKTCNQPIGEKGEFPSGYWKKRGNFHPFSLKGCISVYI